MAIVILCVAVVIAILFILAYFSRCLGVRRSQDAFSALYSWLARWVKGRSPIDPRIAAFNADCEKRVTSVVLCARKLEGRLVAAASYLFKEVHHTLVFLTVEGGGSWLAQVTRHETKKNRQGEALVDILVIKSTFRASDYASYVCYPALSDKLLKELLLDEDLYRKWNPQTVYSLRRSNCQHYADAVVLHFTGQRDAVPALLAKLEHAAIAGVKAVATRCLSLLGVVEAPNPLG